MQSPFISRVTIENFRNFRNVDVSLSHKQIIIGENNVGKTNLIRAIQLILDPRLSDEDRMLGESDFYNGILDPLENGEEIKISIEVQGYENNKTLLAVLCDASISTSPATLKFTYRYYPISKGDGSKEYNYTIYQGNNEANLFTHKQRKYFNIRVISALRDVENEMRNSRKSPIMELLKEYEFNKDELERIASNLKTESNELLSMDEIQDAITKMNSRFGKVIGIQPDSELQLETMDFQANRLISALKLVMGQHKRSTSETSMGLTNLLYISLILLLLEDKTIPSLLSTTQYHFLKELEGSEILDDCYEESDKGNFKLKNDIEETISRTLYAFMDSPSREAKGFTLLALEEPEAHLHPTLQRIIYRDVMQGNTSLLMTTHSPHVTSVAPLESIVHLLWTSDGTLVNTTANIKLPPNEKQDLERYLDVKRGELYFGKAVILVEGIAEEYLIPKFAELLDKPLDSRGILVCNINSTNFTPYVKYLEELGIPYVCITDGDYYIIVKDKEGKESRKYGLMKESDHENFGYLGNEITGQLLVDLQKIKTLPDDMSWAEEDELFSEHGFFLGAYTLETEIMANCKSNISAQEKIWQTFNELTSGGDQQKENFKKELKEGKYDACLRKIENSSNGIGKGRFAQRLSMKCTKHHIPSYIEDAIDKIFEKVDGLI